jgi:Mn2+/Fe2+ NRAMP family transporter
VSLADKLFSVHAVPVWELCLIAAAAVTFMVGALYWMMPPPLRRSRSALSPAAAVLLLVAWVATSRDPHAALWFTAVCSAVVPIPLLWMGPLPHDMPSARDPACRRHPQ